MSFFPSKKLIDPWKNLNVYPTLFVYTTLWLTIAFTFSYSYAPTCASMSYWTTAQLFILVIQLYCCKSKNQFFFHFWKLVLRRNRKQKFTNPNRAGNITQWFCRAIKLCISSVKIFAAILMKVTFEIKSNIYFE